MSRNDAMPTSRGVLLFTVAVSVLVGSFVPFGDTLLYPFTLLATWVHEMGHGLAAIAVGGHFAKLEIFRDASGLAYTACAPGAQSGLVSLGGLIAPPLVGGLILATSRGPARARTVLGVLGAVMLLSLAVWVRSVAGFVAVPLVAGLLLAVARFGGTRTWMFVAQFLGLRLAVDTMGRGLSYLFVDSATIDGVTRGSDIASVAQGFGGPRFFWSLVVSTFCIVVIAGGVLAAWRSSAARTTRKTRT